MSFRRLLVCFAAFAAVPCTFAQVQHPGAAVMVPGLWEITLQTRAPIVGPPITHTVCIDKAHLEKPEPPKSKPSDDCQVQSDAALANETAYTIRCAKRALTSAWRFTYSGDHFEGTGTITGADGEIRQSYTAKRVGACDQPDAPPPTAAKP